MIYDERNPFPSSFQKSVRCYRCAHLDRLNALSRNRFIRAQVKHPANPFDRRIWIMLWVIGQKFCA
jgi:hypothetical protein